MESSDESTNVEAGTSYLGEYRADGIDSLVTHWIKVPFKVVGKWGRLSVGRVALAPLFFSNNACRLQPRIATYTYLG